MMRRERGKDQFRLRCGITQIIDEQHAAVSKRIAMHQGSDVVILREE